MKSKFAGSEQKSRRGEFLPGFSMGVLNSTMPAARLLLAGGEFALVFPCSFRCPEFSQHLNQLETSSHNLRIEISYPAPYWNKLDHNPTFCSSCYLCSLVFTLKDLRKLSAINLLSTSHLLIIRDNFIYGHQFVKLGTK